MIEIVPFQPKHAQAFYELNKEWIEHFFEMEPEDFKVLENPEKFILNPGGFIFMALLNQLPVGACALIIRENNTFELSKMAVSPKFQGLKIGQLLAQKIIEKAKQIGVQKIFLITNSALIPAIALYKKLGFLNVQNFESSYTRGDVKMELHL